jgi:hypothetical protein
MQRLVVAITFLSIFAMATRVSMDTDTWWHLRTGELIAETGSVPTSDSFSYTRAGETWLYPSAAWLMELKLYGLYASFGPGALNVFVAAAVTIALAFVYMALSGGVFLRAFTLILAAAASAVYWAARPYMASFAFTAIFLWILEDFRWRRHQRLIALPLIMLLWANSHPGFAVGFILLAIYAADEAFAWLRAHWQARAFKVKRGEWGAWLRGRFGALLATGAGMIVAVCINPSGPSMLRYPFDTLSIGVLRDFIVEWQSPDFHQRNVWPFVALFFVTLIVLALSKRRIVLSDMLLVSVFGLMALLAGRNIALFALAAPIVLTRHAAPLLAELQRALGIKSAKRKTTRWQRVVNWSIVTLLAATVLTRVVLIFPPAVNERAYNANLPIGAIQFIRQEQPPGNLFNSYNWGGYLIWALRDVPVYVDGRTDLYSDELLEEWLDIIAAEDGWQAQLEAREVRLVLIEPHWPLAKVLAAEGWQLLYADKISVLYGR